MCHAYSCRHFTVQCCWIWQAFTASHYVHATVQSGEAISLDCQCRGELALRHRTCAEKWARVKVKPTMALEDVQGQLVGVSVAFGCVVHVWLHGRKMPETGPHPLTCASAKWTAPEDSQNAGILWAGNFLKEISTNPDKACVYHARVIATVMCAKHQFAICQR